MSAGPQPFAFDDYRAFLRQRMEFLKSEHGTSFRKIAAAAGINSPNYLQRVSGGERHLTLDAAVNVGKSLLLDEDAAEYFTLMVALVTQTDEAAKKSRSAMQKLRRRVTLPVVENDAMHEDWLYAVIWEMATLADFDLTAANAHKRLKGVATLDAVEAALAFLVRKEHLVAPDPARPHRYEQRSATFLSGNDKRRMQSVQASHQKYLEMAKHRLNDDLAEREFQGVTIAVSKDQMVTVKKRLRDVANELASELSNDPKAEAVLRLELCAFFVTKG